MNKFKSLTMYSVLTLITILMLFGVARIERGLDDQVREHHLRFTGQVKNAPPLVSFTTVALGSFRGLIADLLWFRAGGLQEKGSYYEMVQLANWIIDLQPNFSGATVYLAWNMAYNISVTCSDFADRWRWVNEGLKLIRDKAIDYNPEDPVLYKDLAWIFQHKLGNIMDDANLYYKNQLALQITQVIGDTKDFRPWADAPRDERKFLAAYGENERYLAGMAAEGFLEYEQLYKAFKDREGKLPEKFAAALTPELQKEIDLALRSRWLYDKYRMDPALMQDLNDKYGTLEWRLPEAQAIYWATMGLLKTPSHKDISCERIITQSLYEGFRAGRILRLAPDDLSTILLAPNLELVDAVRKTYDEAYERNQANSFLSAKINFMKEAIVTLFRYGKFAKAEEYFNDLKKIDMEPRLSKDLEDFVLRRFGEEVRDAGVKKASDIIVGLIWQSIFYLVNGDADAAAANERMARYIYKSYMSGNAKGQEVRMGLPPYNEIKKATLESSLQSLPPAMAKILKAKIEEEQVLAEQEARLQKQKEKK